MNKWYTYAKRADFKRISEKFGIDPVVARILRNRDIVTDSEIDYFLHGTVRDLYDGNLIPDMEKAASTVAAAISAGEHIRIAGDYDIDGICSTYILYRGLGDAGGRVSYRIPERIRDGYGINRSMIEEAAADGVKLILTCDNGIAALDEMRLCYELGMRAVVTDHHSVRKDSDGSDILPEAEAVADVKRSGSLYPTEETCGAVTAWKLIREVYRLLGLPDDRWMMFLEFAAIATVGDIMKLTGENRIIVREGLRAINRGPVNMGLRVLIRELGLSDKSIDTYHIGFIIGPCINAGGRLETAESVMKLLLCADRARASGYASHLIELNAMRKDMTEQGTRKGIELVEAHMAGDRVLVVYIEGLHEAVAGIVAGRLKEHFGKPCFVITDSRDFLKGSGRSIEAYDMFAALCSADSLLLKYGGHRMAAGLSLEKKNLDSLRRLLNAEQALRDSDLEKKIWIDDPTPLHYISMRFIEQIEALAPFGSGFEKPAFAVKGLRAASMRVLGRSRNALRVDLEDPAGRIYNGIMFGEADRISGELKGQVFDIVYTPAVNEFRGQKSIQIEIKDYRISNLH